MLRLAIFVTHAASSWRFSFADALASFQFPLRSTRIRIFSAFGMKRDFLSRTIDPIAVRVRVVHVRTHLELV